MKLADLDVRKHSQSPFEFELKIEGQPSGVFLQVWGAQAPQVSAELERLFDLNNEQTAAAELAGKPRPIRGQIEFRDEAAAARIAGWRGIDDEFTREGALELVRGYREAIPQIVEESDKIANFLKVTPKTSSPSPKSTSA